MTYIWISRIIFWSFVVLLVTGSLIWLWHVEKLERHQEALAEQQRRRQRIERFRNIR